MYLTGLMISKETKKSVGHKRKGNSSTGKHEKKETGHAPTEESSFSMKCQIWNEKGLNQKVCQRHLLIHDFGKRRFEVLHKKMPVGSAVPEPDHRGKHSNRPLKVPELHQNVRQHIMSFPDKAITLGMITQDDSTSLQSSL